MVMASSGWLTRAFRISPPPPPSGALYSHPDAWDRPSIRRVENDTPTGDEYGYLPIEHNSLALARKALEKHPNYKAASKLVTQQLLLNHHSNPVESILTSTRNSKPLATANLNPSELTSAARSKRDK